MCTDRLPRRRQRARLVGWARSVGRSGAVESSPTANTTARRLHVHWYCSSEHHRRGRHAAQAFRRVHHASNHSEHLVLGDRLPRPAHVRIQLAVRDATLSDRWPAAAGALATATDPSVACSPKLKIAHACPKTRHICTGTAHDFAPTNRTRRGELGERRPLCA